ncbi:SDR family oxidoreductase [Nonomuraea sp. NPDC050643]|uniref:SDR family NAD(P)-dependent oxidoreductase n=1 Tax=Nonomuraea sp. NPDC050643 TaxID=3155660 RepID=UPI0033D6D54F
MGRFTGKTVVVTGGTTGIGLASAKAFAAEGAQVFVTGRRRAELDAAVEQMGGQATGVQGDVSKPDDVDHLYRTIADRGLEIDVLFANAGIAKSCPLESLTVDHIDEMLAINIRGTALTVQKALPLLKDGAAIVVTSSINGSRGAVGSSVYNATKAAVRSFGRTWAGELVGRGIRVNTVSPGPIDTPGLATLAPTPDLAADFHKQRGQAVPMRRSGRPEEVAAVVLFLASDESSYMTGAEIFVDGGAIQI